MLLLFLMPDYFRLWCVMVSFGVIVSIEIHQISWMIITILRYIQSS